MLRGRPARVVRCEKAGLRLFDHLRSFDLSPSNYERTVRKYGHVCLEEEQKQEEKPVQQKDPKQSAVEKKAEE